MKNLILISLIITATFLSACSWKPEVTAVPITAPWSTMNLPVTENAVVWVSTPVQFKAVHKDSKKVILAKYTDALKAAGWKLEKFDDKVADIFWVDMSKGSETIAIEIYDFNGTGVIIDKK